MDELSNFSKRQTCPASVFFIFVMAVVIPPTAIWVLQKEDSEIVQCSGGC